MALLYSVAVFWWNPQGLDFLLSLTVALAGVLTAFKIKSPMELLRLLVLTYVTAFCIGGLSFFIFYSVLQTGSGFLSGIYGGLPLNQQSLPISLLLFSSYAFYILFRLCYTWYQEKIRMKKIYTVTIQHKGKITELPMLLDSGNSLCEPVSGQPVLLVEREVLDKQQEQQMQRHKEDSEQLSKESSSAVLTQLPLGMRIIPFKSVGNKKGTLMGFKPDRVLIEGRESPAVFIGLYEGRLTNSGAYQGLINPAALPMDV